MTNEQALETQRLKLLRLLAGLVAAVVFVSAGPFSSAVSNWVGGVVASILSRAEAAAQCLVIVQARILAVRVGSDLDEERLLESLPRGDADYDDAGSLADLRKRLGALRVLLDDLPRFGMRLLRQTEKRVRRLARAARRDHTIFNADAPRIKSLCAWRLVGSRIERPPD